MSLQHLTTKAAAVRLLVCDVDGVLTDGRLYFTEDGQEFKTFNTLDGLGFKLLQQTGVKIAIITGRKSKVVSQRMTALGVEIVYQGREDKLVVLKDILEQLDLTPEQVAYLGDDLPDLPAIRHVGLGLAVANASPMVKQYAAGVTQQNGGLGAAREVCEFIMASQGTLDAQLAPYLCC
ncbi:3-deoxy-manno-octulosonate-8-phosphatase KdsC [Zooshikella harenae]|uniref:3-deoxy-D-manno-octulosonate 8-phosphate phosphatase KdsC n=1 Tax=Zooshikella harenae TaxID=2827238 RepID=A0ABS5Z7P5_9GAMM|nr:3-deoxy-manno-octulosonate-8-phosphatase KdsC [Zooshikella harenae]MBU2710072.1 3-deoxy-manno-octulosonate-8-phosphatase KdsC [Zooshikella harenae]